jgi:ATP-dependent Clp protease ATP-binding subunit ClpA
MKGSDGEISGINLARVLKTALARGKLRCIGITTDEGYQEHIEKDASFDFEQHFALVTVEKPDTVDILRGLRSKYETHHDVKILDSALISAAELAHQHFNGRLPNSAIDLIDEVCASAQVARDMAPEEIEELERRKLALGEKIAAIQVSIVNIDLKLHCSLISELMCRVSQRSLEEMRVDCYPLTLR